MQPIACYYMICTRIYNIYIIYGYGVIEYTYLVGNTQSAHKPDKSGIRRDGHLYNHHMGNIRIPSPKFTQTHKQTHQSTTSIQFTIYRSHLIPQHKNLNEV